MARRPDDQGPYGAMPQVGFPRLTRVTRRLLYANGAVFLVALALSFTEWWEPIESRLALAPHDWRLPLVPVWQLVTYGFLHSLDDIGHVLFNMLTLYFFGTMLEETIGGRRFLITYLASMVVGAAFFLVPGILSGAPSMAVGASGAVLGIVVVMAVLRPQQTVFFLFIPVTLKVLALIFVGINVFLWLTQLRTGNSGGVAALVHLGGIAYGFVAARAGWIWKDPVEAVERARAVAAVERAADDEARMDRLLEKIHREGMGSLSRSERDFLKRASSRK